MKPHVPNGHECPACGCVVRVLQVPWPHTGEWVPYMPPRFCPHCGARQAKGDGAKEGKHVD